MAPNTKRLRLRTEQPEFCLELPVAEFEDGTNIDVISDKELLAIFAFLPIPDLMAVEVVCRRWRWIHLKACFDKRSLNLVQDCLYRAQLVDITRYWFFSDFRISMKFESVCFNVTKPVNKAAVRWFGDRFPNVTELGLYCVQHLTVDAFVGLMAAWPNMERLTIFGASEERNRQFSCDAFLESLSNLDKLRHLRLPFELDRSQSVAPLESLRFDILYLKMSQMDFHSNGGKSLQGLLNKRRFDLCLQCQLRSYQFWTSIDCQQLARVRDGFYFRNITNRSPIMFDRYTTRSPLVTHFDFSLPSTFQLHSFLSSLANMKSLSTLRLTPHPYQANYLDLFRGVNKRNYRMRLIKRLPQIDTLHLNQFDLTSATFVLLYFSTIFPSLTRIHFENCRFSGSPKWLLTSLMKRFPKLNQVWLNHRLMLTLDRDSTKQPLTRRNRDQKRDALMKVQLMFNNEQLY